MKSNTLKFRAIALPIFTLAISSSVVTYQYARHNRFVQDLKASQAEYVRLTKSMPSVPASASSLFSESKEHTHSEAEEAAEHHAEAKSSTPAIQEPTQGHSHDLTQATKLPR